MKKDNIEDIIVYIVKWGLIMLIAVSIIAMTTRVVEEKITQNEMIYKQCINTCNDKDFNGFARVQCVEACNDFYLRLVQPDNVTHVSIRSLCLVKI